MATEHNVLTDPELHEPKGVAAATAGQVYRADGSASGDWKLNDAYGHIYTIDSDSKTLDTIGTTAKKGDLFANDGVSNGTTCSASTDTITVLTAGDYYISFNMSFSTVAAGDSGDYEFHIRVDDVESILGVHRELSGTADAGSVAVQGILALTANEVVSVWIESDNGSDTDDIDIYAADLTVNLLRAT